MYQSQPIPTTGWRDAAPRAARGVYVAELLLRVVDAGLFSVICIAPFFFGGRHDLGRLVLVSLVAVTSAAWFARQAISPTASWPRTFAYALFILAAALLVLQIVPLAPQWIAQLSPRTAELLPVWAAQGGDGLSLGTWRTLSLSPHETVKSLAMLASYGLLFVVVVGRIQYTGDIRRLLNFVALAAAIMAAFAIVHYFTSDGRYFWFYAHAHRSATQNLSGAFINRNHFAHFLVLGLGPLVAWLLYAVTASEHSGMSQKTTASAALRVCVWATAAALAIVAAAILASRSRGGAIAMVVAGAVLMAIYVSRRVVDSRFLYGLVSLGVVVVGLLSMHGYDRVAKRLDDLTEGSIEEMDQTGIRRKIWSANIAAFQAGWLTGAGAGSHREICPVYLHETFVKEYTHAENGYLQVATETGVVGVALLVVAISMCGWWMFGCLRHARQHEHVFLFGAAAAGLVASAAHSVVDFVWYIPACMSVTIVLAACVLRLSQLVRSSDGQARGVRTLHRGRWLELAVASILIGAWSIHTYFGPAIAAVHWDQYRRAAVADTRISQQAFAEFSSGKAFAPSGDRQALSQAMLRRLQAAVYWDPHFARAHKQLADRYMAEFALRVSEAANVLDVRQIRDVAIASSFPSEGALQEWLDRAFGPDVELLRQAHVHARRAVELCPLQGGAYMHLADLAFLELGTHSTVEAYVDQALRLRPYDRNVLADAGVQALVLGEPARAIDVWSRCFNTPGSHQQRIVYRLVASGMPASEFLARLRPDWQTLRSIWAQYRTTGRPQDLSDILLYAENETRRAAAESNRNKLAAVLFWQSNLYSEVGRREESLACLERANGCNPRSFAIRYGLAKALMDAGRFAEAEPHVRWCLARRPADKALNAALPIISKYRLAQRAPVSSMQNSQSAGVPAEKSARSTAAATN